MSQYGSSGNLSNYRDRTSSPAYSSLGKHKVCTKQNVTGTASISLLVLLHFPVCSSIMSNYNHYKSIRFRSGSFYQNPKVFKKKSFLSTRKLVFFTFSWLTSDPVNSL
uniref:Ovule protein n=1 Tax=Angiostrongylus cantonensis TaxID=6313 RepID=A0A0K0DQ83_ANGCA